MKPLIKVSYLTLLTVFAVTFPIRAQDLVGKASRTAGVPVSALWNDRGDFASLNVFYGAGGKEHEPSGKFTFVEEDKAGSSPKFVVVDDKGVRWRVKLGDEMKSETAATRLVWAAGYFTDEDYYVPELRVENLPKLERGANFVSADGVIQGARLERKLKGEKKDGNWSWFKNPFVGTKELDGLRVMMALINNWDLKEDNNAVYDLKGEGVRYVVSDLGASFGQTGNAITRSKSNVGDYSGSKFIQKVTADHVDFFLSSRPFFLSAIDAPYYAKRTHMQDVVKHIPIDHVKWLGQILAQLSDEQLRDCFRAGGYAPVEAELIAAMVKQRIKDLNSL
jgi:hypothetical protein